MTIYRGVAGLLVAALFGWTVPAEGGDTFAGDGRWMVRASGGDAAAQREVLSWGDVGDYRSRKGFLLLEVDAERVARLRALGFAVEVDEERTAWMAGGSDAYGLPFAIPGFPCYRTVEETYAAAQALATSHPQLATVLDAGDSWEKLHLPGSGYDLIVLRLTNAALPGPKPKLFAVASMHAREYTPAEIAMRFAEQLVAGYGVDPDATWILDFYEVHLLLQGNPDGRKHAEAGESWRKNTNTDYCPALNPGADLNRNYAFQWSCCGGSSGDPCDETYRGAAPDSEPEVDAVQDYVRSVFVDSRPDDLTTPAPDDTEGLFLDVHSFQQVVLTPWGFVDPNVSPPPNGAQLRRAAKRLAYLSGYDPTLYIYDVDGSSTDFAYGDLGVAALAFEMGSSFFESCASFEGAVLPEGLSMLRYAARIARRPYTQTAGPDVVSVTAGPMLPTPGQPVTLAGVADDGRYSTYGGVEPTQPVASALATIDVPPWAPGATPIALSASDGAFDETQEGIAGTLPTAGLPQGRHLVFLQAVDSAGNAGPPAAALFWILDPATAPVLSGKVRAAGTGAPLAATVAVGPFQTTTAPGTGAFSIQLPPGSYDVSVRAAGHQTMTEPGVVLVEQGAVSRDYQLEPFSTLFADNGEGGSSGWTAQSPWALTTETAASPTHSWSDSPGGNYGNDVDTSLVSPVVNLTGATGVSLAFAHVYNFESGWDFGHVEVSATGGPPWVEVSAFTGVLGSWQTVSVPAPALDGASQARFRFRLTSDISQTRDGWHVDDVVVRAVAPHPLFADGFESGDASHWWLKTP